MQSQLHKVVGIYGSADRKPGTPDFVDAYELGKALGQAGYAVMTGGYGGAMDAASQRTAKLGDHVIDVTVGMCKECGLMWICG